jgi:F-type H+-transporting ATPase subunit a
MDQLGKVTLSTITLLGHQITFNPITFIMTWISMALILFLAYIATKNLKVIPGKAQSIFEVIHDFLYDITVSTLGEKDGRKYFPFILTLFVFILLANWIGIFPNVFQFSGMIIAGLHKIIGGPVEFANMAFTVTQDVWYSFLLNAPGIQEPTRSVNTDLALAILVFIACQAYGIKNKGLYRYIRSFADDPFPMKGPLILLFFINPFFYLNLIGMVANVVSHSFRLFGNIFGGFMIVVIVSWLTKFFIVPVGLLAFFGLFAGLVQAFVFTMLAVTYIQQQQ